MANISYSDVSRAIESFCHIVDSTNPDLRLNLRGAQTTRPDPSKHECSTSFALHWAAYNLLRKSPEGASKSQVKKRKADTLSGWIAAESHCYRTNERLALTFCEDPRILTAHLGRVGDADPTLGAVIVTAQRKIRSLLGPFSISAAQKECKWSLGATSDHKRGTLLGKRISSTLSVTPRAVHHLRSVMSEDLHWSTAYVGTSVEDGPVSPLVFNLVNASRGVLVSKTRDKDRVIAAEPTGNAFLQQGVGRLVRKLLKRVTVDLDDQSYNQFCAGIAQRIGLATLDLESASDTVSVKIVKLLLPEEWFNYLFDLRCDFMSLDGRTYKLEKFSSMGNAFTFELESLIFWALASSVTELYGFGDANLAVYGDDIIVPQPVGRILALVLEFCGFKINRDKSFFDGRFFESCGKHYFDGDDVTPPLVTKRFDSPHAAIKYHNKIWRWHARVSAFSTVDIPWRHLVTPCEREPGYRLYKQPSWVEGDFGYIVSRKRLDSYDANRGYRCAVLLKVSLLKAVPQEHHTSLLAYKLRRPSYLNAGRDGQASYEVQEHSYRDAVMYFPKITTS